MRANVRQLEAFQFACAQCGTKRLHAAPSFVGVFQWLTVLPCSTCKTDTPHHYRAPTVQTDEPFPRART